MQNHDFKHGPLAPPPSPMGEPPHPAPPDKLPSLDEPLPPPPPSRDPEDAPKIVVGFLGFAAVVTVLSWAFILLKPDHALPPITDEEIKRKTGSAPTWDRDEDVEYEVRSPSERRLDRVNREIEERIPEFREKLRSHSREIVQDMEEASPRSQRTLRLELEQVAKHMIGLDKYEEEMKDTRTELRSAYRAERRAEAGLPTIDIDLDEVQEIYARAEARLGQELGSPEGSSVVDRAEIERKVRELMDAQ